MFSNKFTNERNGFLISLIGTIQYLILLMLSMYFYAGGNYLNANSPKYDFFLNYISDLSRTVSLSNNSNMLSCIFYMIGSIILALSLMIFMFYFTRMHDNIFSQISIFFGVICCSTLLVGAFIFWDIFGYIHVIFANIFNISGLIAILFLAITIFKNENYPNFYGILLLILFILGIMYSFTFFIFTQNFSFEVYYFQVVSQKIVHFFFVSTFLIQEIGAFKLTNSQ
ncbi:MAG: hypothetical protein ACTSVE_03540 [Candidatus Helarchaeota archaeon]